MLQKHITKLKEQPKYEFWSAVGSQAIQDITERIDKGYKLFFNNRKRGVKSAPPSFSKVSKYKSFTLKQAGWKLITSNRIRIGKHVFSFHKSREILGQVKTLTVKRNGKGEIFVYLSAKLEIPKSVTTTGKIAGFDFGLKTFLTCSNGQKIESPLFLKQSLDKVKEASKKFSKKQKGSSNKRACKYTLANVYESVADKRRDWFFKLSDKLTNEFDYLFFEDLNLKGMQRMWGRKVSDLAFSEFLSILEYVAKKKNKVVHYVDRFFPSSKTCHHCGFINNELELFDRRWRCKQCNNVNDRDENAALNIYSDGASSLGLDEVRREPAFVA